jgi:hypothetical protein
MEAIEAATTTSWESPSKASATTWRSTTFQSLFTDLVVQVSFLLAIVSG